jgi:hypothetical protein
MNAIVTKNDKTEKTAKIDKAVSKAENKFNKAEIIRSAFKQFGMTTPTDKIREHYKKVTGDDVDSRYIHLTKSNMKKSMAESTPIKPKAPVKSINSGNSDVAANIIKLRDLIEAFGGKDSLLAVLNVI